MAGPRISVIIPTYNQAGFLRECLASLAAQTMPEWEAIVINNHSDDDTVGVVERLNDARVTLIHFRNDGIIAASRNLGMEKARAGWIAFLDSDDRWRPAKLERCLAAVTPDIDVLGHGMVMFRDGRDVRTVRSGPEARTRYRSLLFDGTCITPSAAMVRKDWLDRVGRFSEDAGYRTAEDYELWLKLSRAGARFAFIPDLLTEYRMHEASASGLVAVHLAASLKIVEDHYAALPDKSLRDKMRYRKRIASLHHGAARKYLPAGEARLALAAARTSIGIYPVFLRAYVTALASLILNMKS